ncbi:MAG: transcription termination/antitermination NusG family protein, partial [Phycisphaerae bacterium]
KESENPPIIWPEVESIRDFTGSWWVAHTKSRNEKALAHDLIGRNISYFLPMTWRIWRRSRRTMRSLLPLFSGYLFFCGGENQRLELLRTNRVANIIEVKDQQQLLGELMQVEQALRAGAPLTPYKYIKAGQRCRVIAGPLFGLEGIIVKTKNVTRLVLQIDMLGQAASVEIDIDMIEVIDEGRDTGPAAQGT